VNNAVDFATLRRMLSASDAVLASSRTELAVEPSGLHEYADTYGAHDDFYHGVTWGGAPDRWRARISWGGCQHYLGLHRSREEAARAYDSELLRLRSKVRAHGVCRDRTQGKENCMAPQAARHCCTAQPGISHCMSARLLDPDEDEVSLGIG
jgi:hypothetical protein